MWVYAVHVYSILYMLTIVFSVLEDFESVFVCDEGILVEVCTWCSAVTNVGRLYGGCVVLSLCS